MNPANRTKNKWDKALHLPVGAWRTSGCLVASLVILSLLVAAPRAKYRHHGEVLLNDLSVTPGAIRTTDANNICNGGSTKQYRHTTQAMKNQVYAAYGVERNKGICAGGCEVDHVLPLEIGGADDVRNLWPQPSQPKPGFHEKDILENYVHKEVCSGRMNLAEAQAKLVNDWYAFYLEIHKLPAGSSGAK